MWIFNWFRLVWGVKCDNFRLNSMTIKNSHSIGSFFNLPDSPELTGLFSCSIMHFQRKEGLFIKKTFFKWKFRAKFMNPRIKLEFLSIWSNPEVCLGMICSVSICPLMNTQSSNLKNILIDGNLKSKLSSELWLRP
jgi:hypothetical protein